MTPAAETLAAEARAEIRVLVVEDEETAAAAHAAYVDRTPGFVLAGVARSASDAVRRLDASRSQDPTGGPADGPVDLLLLDMHLPDGHGLGLLQRIRAAGHLCDVIAVTSARDSEVVRAAVAQGVVLYLLKPFTYASFRTKLEQYLGYRDQLSGGPGTGPVDQERLDQVLGALRPIAAPPAKGMSAETREQVLTALRSASGARSATEVATATGTSRVTARRYLEQLTEQGVLTRAARYGGSGRPELEYRLV